ncbi:MAG: hypothetical protein FKY71_04615 [Spiribacter salinus]|uniref:Uncharacterized protein n=1 Tax=Spiribacter salinus TaxID=1335746 RepID=A0A540VTV6_9GAMM|nr:MAG: hypothetical protein FKY71_04615 [Spiribacter salinus]
MVLAAGLGTPAIYLQATQYAIPGHLLTYEHALRAGALPAGALIAIGIYLYWLCQGEARDASTTAHRYFWGALAPLGTVGLISALAIGSIAFVGSFALLFVLAWYASYYLLLLASLLFSFNLTHNMMLMGAFVMLAVLILPIGIVGVIREEKRASERRIPDECKDAGSGSARSSSAGPIGTAEDVDTPAEAGAAQKRDRARKPFDWEALSIFAAAPALCFVSLYAVQAVHMLYTESYC